MRHWNPIRNDLTWAAGIRFIYESVEVRDNNKHCIIWILNIIRDLNGLVRDAMCCIFCPVEGMMEMALLDVLGLANCVRHCYGIHEHTLMPGWLNAFEVISWTIGSNP